MYKVLISDNLRYICVDTGWLRKIYERTRLPIVPIYGGFPVKMKTYVGDPIYPEPANTPEQLAEKVWTFMDFFGWYGKNER